MDGPFECIHTITDYYDGPRAGIADFRGQPHVYRSLWLQDEDEWDDDRFELSPVGPDVFALAMESWAIWQRFEAAYKSGAIEWSGDESTWGALPRELARRMELERLLSAALIIDPAHRTVAHAEFRACDPGTHGRAGIMRDFAVRWVTVE